MKSFEPDNEIERKLIDTVKIFEISYDDFDPHTGGGNIVHEALLMELRKNFLVEHNLYPESEYMNLDLTAKEFLDGVLVGRISLALELDTENLNPASNNKLADVRANNKCWILVTKRKRTPRKNFEEYLDFIKRSLIKRNETKEYFGNFIVILKLKKYSETSGQQAPGRPLKLYKNISPTSSRSLAMHSSMKVRTSNSLFSFWPPVSFFSRCL